MFNYFKCTCVVYMCVEDTLKFKFTFWVFHKTFNKLSNTETSVHTFEDFNETNVNYWITNLYFDLYLDFCHVNYI